ncbi:MAG: acyltransferase [bacterium]
MPERFVLGRWFSIKALKEIGLKKALKFLLLTICSTFFRILIFPNLRVIFLRLLGARIGKDTVIHDIQFSNLYRRGLPGLHIGNSCFIGNGVHFDLADEITLSDNVTISDRVLVLTHLKVGYSDHPLQKYFPAFSSPVIFKDGCFIGANSTILAGVVIGSQAFVAAGSVVKENVPPGVLVAGVPARVIKKIAEDIV